MVNKVNLTGMTPWGFNNKKGSEWKQEKLDSGNFAEVLEQERGKLNDGTVHKMREGIGVGRENLRSESC